MYGIDLLMKEHLNIIAFTEYMKNCCCVILEGADVDIGKFKECIDFARSYADKHHHGKEEQILFCHMLENPSSATVKLIQNGIEKPYRQKIRAFEANAEQNDIQKKYLKWLDTCSEK